MEAIKTAISIERNLFEQADELARTMKVSRSKLFVLALQEYMEHRKNRELLAQIDAAYSEEPDTSEKTLRRKVRRLHRELVEGEW